MGLGGLLYFGAKASLCHLPGDISPGAISGDSFQKSTVFGLRGVAPGGRFWHGPADLRGRPSGQGRPPFYASAAIAVMRGVEQKI
jgi:hypothetical protein